MQVMDMCMAGVGQTMVSCVSQWLECIAVSLYCSLTSVWMRSKSVVVQNTTSSWQVRHSVIIVVPAYISTTDSLDVPCISQLLFNVGSSDGGKVLSWGWNEHGMCGTGTEENCHQLHLLFEQEVQSIGCGYGHCLVFIQSHSKADSWQWVQ